MKKLDGLTKEAKPQDEDFVQIYLKKEKRKNSSRSSKKAKILF